MNVQVQKTIQTCTFHGGRLRPDVLVGMFFGVPDVYWKPIPRNRPGGFAPSVGPRENLERVMKKMGSYLLPDLGRSALLTIDVQRDTLDGQPCEIPGTSEIIPEAKRVIDCFRNRLLPIIHVVRIYLPDGSNVDLCRRRIVEEGGKLFIAGSEGAELAEGLLPDGNSRLDADLLLSGGLQRIGESEWIMYKPRWGAFYKTPLERHLQKLDVSTIVVIGCNYPNCPRTSIYEASERDFKIIAVSDAISKFDDRAEKELENIGVVVKSANLLLQECGPSKR
jgi:nicotinamidase-related amidase